MLKIDKVIVIQSRGNFARIYVELNLDKPLQPKVKAGDYLLNLQYEGLHIICFKCDCYGHKDSMFVHGSFVTENDSTMDKGLPTHEQKMILPWMRAHPQKMMQLMVIMIESRKIMPQHQFHHQMIVPLMIILIFMVPGSMLKKCQPLFGERWNKQRWARKVGFCST